MVVITFLSIKKMLSNSDMTQHYQWSLLEQWYQDTNPRKDFDLFLNMHGFPMNIYDDNAPYYIQIRKKFWHACRQNDPVAWIKEKQLEDAVLEEVDNDIHTFTHEAASEMLKRKMNEKIQSLNDTIYYHNIYNTLLSFTTLVCMAFVLKS